MNLDPRVCERARLSRDPRFDGRFFIGVVTTGVYCRPVCPVQPPLARNVRFFPSAAAASETGFRPCLRCRPESSPGTPAWLGTSATVSRALRLIAEGALDEDGDVERLAGLLGVGPRHLHRLFCRHLGASPVAVAQTRRLHFAKKLIDETDLPMAQVAFSAGFGSVRRFNHVVRTTYGRTPTELRRRRVGSPGRKGEDLVLRLSFRPPFDWGSLTRFLAPRATPGVEQVGTRSYSRTVALDGQSGVITVAPSHPRDAGARSSASELELRIRFSDPRSLFKIVERVRKMFDLGADPAEISRHLGAHPRLAPLVTAHPGLRLPAAWDGFELAVRAILGQQVTVRGATTLAGRLAETFGVSLSEDEDEAGRPHRLFPTADALSEADLTQIGLPRKRAQAIRHLAREVAAGRICFDASVGWETLVERLVELPGVGDWTAQYVAMRALGAPDAFPATDLGLLKATANGKVPATGKTLLEEAEAWRPWRAYAALYLWQSLGADHDAKPEAENADIHPEASHTSHSEESK